MSDRSTPQSFPFTQGEGFVMNFVADGPIVGATVRFWAARVPGDPHVLSTESSPPTAVATVTTSPNFTVSIADEDTESLLGTYHYEVQLEDSFGNKSKAARGYLTFKKQVE